MFMSIVNGSGMNGLLSETPFPLFLSSLVLSGGFKVKLTITTQVNPGPVTAAAQTLIIIKTQFTQPTNWSMIFGK